MQEQAICDDRYLMTAFEVREEYLEHGTRYEEFHCPDCDVPLEPKAIYGEKFKKVAHFALPKGTLHKPPCAPKGEVPGSGHAPRPTFVHGVDVRLPAKLIEARPARTSARRSSTAAQGLSGGATTGSYRGPTRVADNQPATTLLQVVVEAWSVARKACYEVAPRDKDGSPDHKWVAECLRAYPLDMYGTPSNYDRAFHKFTSPWKGPAIHHGYNRVELGTDGFSIQADPCIFVTRDPEGQRLEKSLEYLGDVQVRLESAGFSMLRDRLHAKLTRIATSGQSVRWFAFGEMALDAETKGYILRVESARHIYIETEA